MNILIAVDRFHLDLPGGAYMIAWELARLLRDRRHHVALLCAGLAGKHTPGLDEHEGVQIARYLPPTGRWSLIGRARKHLAAAEDVAQRFLGDRRWDVVYGHTLLPAIAAFRACGADARRAYTIHSPAALEQEINWSNDGLAGRVKLMFGMPQLKRLEAEVLRRATALQALSQYTRRTMNELYGVGECIAVIPYWSPREGDAPRISRDEARRRLGWRSEGPIFFSLRRMVPRMGLQTALEAAAPLAREHAFTLVMAGSGPLREFLERRAGELGLAERVRFPGRLSDADVSLAYQAADVFLLPTQALECFGLIILEAYSSGCPVLASDAGAIPELVRQVSPEWIFPAGDTAALREKLAGYLSGALAPPNRDSCAALVTKSYTRDRLFPLWYEFIVGDAPPSNER